MNLLVSVGVGLLTMSSVGSVRIQHDVVYAEGGQGRLDVYSPRVLRPHAPVAVLVYGGSWQSGEKGLYGFVGLSLASRSIVTVIPDYRVYPQVRYPDFLTDNAQAVAFAKQHAAEWGGDSDRLYLIGHSAGAYNVAMLALDPPWLGSVSLDSRREIKGVVGLAGPYDFLPLRDPKLKIIFGPEECLTETQLITHVARAGPPMRLLAGSKDTVVDPGNSMQLAAAIRAHGGLISTEIYPGLGHVSLITSVSGLFRHRAPVLDDITAFIAGDSMPRPGRALRARVVSPQTAGT